MDSSLRVLVVVLALGVMGISCSGGVKMLRTGPGEPLEE
jgi:hypothetical protein